MTVVDVHIVENGHFENPKCEGTEVYIPVSCALCPAIILVSQDTVGHFQVR